MSPSKSRRFVLLSLILAAALPPVSPAASPSTATATARATPFQLTPAPRVSRPVLRTGDRLAICGDSITEQRMYSRILETYLTACTPELNLDVRQFGWSGERADGFFERMQNDVLRFEPTVATTCYGMNDHRYRAYEPWIGELYRIHMDAILRWFEENDVRVVVGSPGCVGRVPGWVRDAGPTVEILNASLAEHRNIAAELAREHHAAFADVFKPMWEADAAARLAFGTNYAVAGKDGVHPGWAGHLLMAYAFLDALGIQGDIGTLNVDASRHAARATTGHEVLSTADGVVTIRSTRYPFCIPAGDQADDGSIRSGLQWVPFQERFNRFILRVRGIRTEFCRVTWGTESRVYSAAQLRDGVNLAADFVTNPFSEAFQQVDDAVAAKQAFETKQVKAEFHGAAGKADMEGTVRRTESERASLVAAIHEAMKPVTHTLQFTPQ